MQRATTDRVPLVPVALLASVRVSIALPTPTAMGVASSSVKIVCRRLSRSSMVQPVPRDVCREAGLVGGALEGDCFTSYDTRESNSALSFVPSNSRHYYERERRGRSVCIPIPSAHMVVDDLAALMFHSVIGCRFDTTFIGAVYASDTTVQTCAAYCLKDSCCLGFNAGTGDLRGTCTLLYDSVVDNPARLMCDAMLSNDYYLRTCSLVFSFVFVTLVRFRDAFHCCING
jgi:hypothetical protein